MKDEAVEVTELRGLDESDVHEVAAVEALEAGLLDHHEPVFELLTLEDRMQVVQKDLQVRGTISERRSCK